MHPPLSQHLHPMCQEAIDELQLCHTRRTLAKFLGACNKAKAALDKCLSDEYLVRRELNAADARHSKQRLRDEQQQFQRSLDHLSPPSSSTSE